MPNLDRNEEYRQFYLAQCFGLYCRNATPPGMDQQPRLSGFRLLRVQRLRSELLLARVITESFARAVLAVCLSEQTFLFETRKLGLLEVSAVLKAFSRCNETRGARQ